MNIKKFICEDSIDGIFTAIYNAWESNCGHENIRIEVTGNGTLELFTEYIMVSTDYVKSEKVARTLKRRLGITGYESICYAALSKEETKAEVIYRTVILGLSLKDGTSIMDCITYAPVAQVFNLSRAVSNEAHHLLGFVRFQELSQGVLISKFSPKNNVLTLIAPHFEDRLCLENWILYDTNRKLAVLHQSRKPWVLVSGENLDEKKLKEVSDTERGFQELWKEFCKSISVKERENKRLQNKNIPLRFQRDMVEFI